VQTIDLTGRKHRLDELVWVLSDCGVRDARFAIDLPDEAVAADDAVTALAAALVVLRSQRVPTPA
jgi:hypothetical protein